MLRARAARALADADGSEEMELRAFMGVFEPDFDEEKLRELTGNARRRDKRRRGY